MAAASDRDVEDDDDDNDGDDDDDDDDVHLTIMINTVRLVIIALCLTESWDQGAATWHPFRMH